ncbi:restriction endonuclease subunit S [Streptomyces sp. NPDC051064]|uniref:restriction endonuclease subunit S n=1 Tax=Streptomyces sp. NPDC051064 TaxID=3365641 RepID=UPI0037BC5D22
MSWPTTKLKWAATTIAGGTPSVSDPAYWEEDDKNGLDWISISDMSGRTSVAATGRRVSMDGIRAARLPIGNPGTLIMSMYASLGHTAFLTKRASWNQAILGIIPSITHDVRFLKYALEKIKPTLTEIARSNTQANLNAEQVGNLVIPNPPLEEQRRIADFLDTETARVDALVKAYERVKSLASERSQTVIDAEIDREPADTPLRYIVRFREGPGIMAVDFQQHGVPLIRISGLQEGEVTLRGCNFLSPEKAARQWHHFRLQLGDRLISGSATMGSVSIVRDPEVVGSIPYTGLIILRPARSGVEMDYVEAFLKSSRFSRQIDVLKTGATMQHFGPTHLSQVQASLPSVENQRRVIAKVGDALRFSGQVTRLANRQIALLTERRQALITAAVTGQFDVSTASGRNVTDGVSA